MGNPGNRMTIDEYKYFLHLKIQARYRLESLKRNRSHLSTSKKAGTLTAIAAGIWLAIGASRYEESYNQHGVRI
ncbi:hypothetical protein [Methylobacter marinus]|uniref:hypothetical protein n=1 Tax=Methylobacter marinus TaxID=34058 RepID=UPI00037DE7D6|nr:hypothetical protein [Methylobacter marinus]